MPHTNRAEKSSKSREDDRISALPDDVLHHVLGFLPAVDAVHTCLLAKRWRYLWKSIRRLRISEMGRQGRSTDVFLTKFVSCLLLLRDPGSTLDEVEIEYAHRFEYDHAWISTWIRHALSCQAQVLTVKYPFQGYATRYLDGPPLVSRYLRRLEISGVRLKSNFLSFSSCSTLEDLKIEGCDLLETSSILSQSLKHLSIKDCYFKHDGRVHISVPNLVSLQLKSFGGRNPLLESMMSLETAVVGPSNCFMDYCLEGVAEGCCGTCGDCCGNDDHNGGCVLLGGLSRAKNLELIADPIMFIFRRDLRWCPTFSRLKTLLLSEWCVQPDLHALVCMLEHSPVLENLTLQLRKGYVTRYLDGPPLVSQYLRRLEISEARLKSNFLKFSSCSTLEDLKIKDCDLDTNTILSQSVKHLSIKDCVFKDDLRISISVPNLVSLQLISCVGRTPFLESMLSLETAVVSSDIWWMDYCLEGFVAGECCGTCPYCCGSDGYKGGCVLLGGLSHAKNLELIAQPGMFIFNRDLRWCPTFSKLKTLLLNEWCVQPDLRALVCMLEHSPVLENLTLQLRKQEKPACAVEVEENPGLVEKPAAISGYLKIIKIKCEEVDDRVYKVLNFLSTFGIEITIERTNG